MQPLFAPSSVQLLDGDRSVLFTLADGSRHEARLIPSARARNLRLRLSPDKGLLLTVPADIPATALPALLFSFLPWLERQVNRAVIFLFFSFFFFFWPCLSNAEVPRSEREPEPQQRPEPQH